MPSLQMLNGPVRGVDALQIGEGGRNLRRPHVLVAASRVGLPLVRPGIVEDPCAPGRLRLRLAASAFQETMMHTISRRSFALLAGLATLGSALTLPVSAQTAPTRNKALFQVTDNDPARWNLVLSNIINLRDGVGREGVDIELVAYGPGILMLKADSSVKQRIADVLKSGVKVNVCENKMKFMKFTQGDMLPDVGYVPSGVVDVMKKQQQGWAYIRS